MILLRHYTTEDSVQLSEAINQVCSGTTLMSTRRFIPTGSWVHAMKMDNCRYHWLFVAETDGNVVGWCRSFPLNCGALPSQAELGIGLLAQFRTRGIGSELIMRSLEWAKATGIQTMDLTVSQRNSIAIHVFKKCGFETVQIAGSKMQMSTRLS
jgi:RimJ/RimL family protein N-acetyltransferase